MVLRTRGGGAASSPPLSHQSLTATATEHCCNPAACQHLVAYSIATSTSYGSAVGYESILMSITLVALSRVPAGLSFAHAPQRFERTRRLNIASAESGKLESRETFSTYIDPQKLVTRGYTVATRQAEKQNSPVETGLSC